MVDCQFVTSESWTILSSIEQSIKRKIEAVGTPLKNWNIKIYRGILTGCNEAFIINGEKRQEILANCRDEEERSRTDELIRPILRGKDIKRYGFDWANLYLIATFPSRHYDIERYPAVKKYFLTFDSERLKKAGRLDLLSENRLQQFCRGRLDQTGCDILVDGEKIFIDGEVQKSRKKTGNKWFETQDQIGYWDDFSKPKIVWGNLCLHAEFSKAPENMFLNAPSVMITPCCDFLLAILNSMLGDWYIRTLGVTRNGGYFEYKPMFVEQLPVPLLSPQEQNEIGEKLLHASTEEDLDEQVFNLYHLTPQERDFLKGTHC